MAIRFSINSQLNQIHAPYTVTCTNSITTGHADQLDEAYEAASILARRSLADHDDARATITEEPTPGSIKLVAVVTYEKVGS